MAADLGGLGRRELEARVGSLADAFGPRLSTLASGPARGLRSVEVTTGSGLDATLVPDRGGDLFSLRWRGVPLGFHGSPGLGSPALYRPEGRGWLHTFSGLVETCGLRNAGHPSGGEGMHGQIAHAHADTLAATAAWEGDAYVTTVATTHREAVIFGAHLQLERTWRIRLGGDAIELTDTITNAGFAPEHLMLLYHINAGYPLLDDATELELDGTPAPRDEDARRGASEWNRMGPPEPGAAEQVFFFEGATRARIASPLLGCALAIEWDAAQLPFATEWKCLAAGTYALGVEPGTCHPIGREQAIASGQAPLLEPGASHTASLRLRVEPL